PARSAGSKAWTSWRRRPPSRATGSRSSRHTFVSGSGSNADGVRSGPAEERLAVVVDARALDPSIRDLVDAAHRDRHLRPCRGGPTHGSGAGAAERELHDGGVAVDEDALRLRVGRGERRAVDLVEPLHDRVDADVPTRLA